MRFFCVFLFLLTKLTTQGAGSGECLHYRLFFLCQNRLCPYQELTKADSGNMEIVLFIRLIIPGPFIKTGFLSVQRSAH